MSADPKTLGIRKSAAAIAALFLLGIISPAASAAEPEQELLSQAEFLSASFQGAAPQRKSIWLTGARRTIAEEILGHAPKSARIVYWQSDNTTAWIFDEIGKERPITIGVSIRGDVVQAVKILKYRESRGWEVKHSFFLDQFSAIGLTQDGVLTQNIDGISGATLSVRAVKRVVRLSLALHRERTKQP